MPGPKSWAGDKRRRKRPQSAEANASMEQEVGKVIPAKRQRGAQTPMRRPSKSLSSAEKRLRALNKKLREIEQLQERQAAVETSVSSTDLVRSMMRQVGRGGSPNAPEMPDVPLVARRNQPDRMGVADWRLRGLGRRRIATAMSEPTVETRNSG